MAELGEAFIPIRATLDKLDGDLSKAKSMVSGALDNLGKVGGAAIAGGLAVATAAIGAVTGALVFSIGQALEAEKGQARLAAVIKSTGGAAGITQDRANELAQSFKDLAGGSDDAIVAIEEIGIRAGSVTNDTMPGFIQASLDLGAVMGDTAGAAQLLARAQEDPVGAMGRLMRAGVQFSPVLKEQIADMVKAGDSAGATALLMDRVAEATGGAAAANANTLSGQWEILKGTLSEAAESIGTALLPTMRSLFDNVIAPAIPIVEAIAGEFAALISSGNLEHLDNVMSLIAGVFELFGFNGRDVEAVLFQLEGAFFAVADVVTGTIVPAVQEFIKAAQPVVEQVVAWLSQNVKLQDVLIALGVAIAAFVVPAIISVIVAAAPIVATFLAVIAIVALLRTAWENDWGGIQEKTAAAWAVIKPLLDAAIAWLSVNIPQALAYLKALWDANWPAISATLQAVWAQIVAAIGAATTWIQNTIQTVLAGISAFWTAHGAEIMAAAKVAWDTIQAGIKTALDIIQSVITAVSAAMKGDWRGFGEALREAWDKAWEAIKTVVRTAWPIIQGLVSDLIANVKSFFTTTDWGAVGKSIIDGIAAGLRNAAGFLADAARAAAQAALDAAKGFLGIHSPSTVFEGVGRMSMEGLAAGIVKNAGLARDAMVEAIGGDGLLGLSGPLLSDGGTGNSVTYSSVTHVSTSADPMRVLRASRHLDKLGALT